MPILNFTELDLKKSGKSNQAINFTNRDSFNILLVGL